MCMKNLLLIFALVALTACTTAATPSKTRPEQTLTHKAYYYYGLNEQKDRTLLRQLLGVDPVITEWCAAFVNLILLENDLPQSSTVSDYALTARSFLQWGEEVKEGPRKGDILVFTRGDSEWKGHVGFYVSHKLVDGKVYFSVLGGNQSNSVSIASYPASRLLSIRRLSNQP